MKRHSGEERIGGGWDEVLREETDKPYWSELLAFVAQERATHVVYPPAAQTFRAFELTPYDKVRVVILGQDPYPNPGQAHGLAFSVPAGVTKPGSLKNIHRVLESDLSPARGHPVVAPEHGSLEGWADQGVLLLNPALTVRSGTKQDRHAHRRWRWKRQGWTTFTDAMIQAVDRKQAVDHNQGVVFLLWGNDAKKKQKLIRNNKVIISSHPSPLSARRGFLTSHPFSEANKELSRLGRGEIDWERVERRA